MAVVVADMPRFSIENDDDLELFINRYIGYLNAIGVNPNALGGPPTGRKRAMGILRGCLMGEAGRWFDEKIDGKNWKLSYLLWNGGAGNIGAIQALNIVQGAVGGGALNANSYVPGSPADAYYRVVANAGQTVQQALVPSFDMLGGDVQWERVGGEPTNDPANVGAGGVNGQPIVLQDVFPHQALSYMRRKLPSILEEKRKVELHKLVQRDDPVRTYWKKVERAGKLLRLPEEVVIDHFYRGLSSDCLEEADRLDPDLPIKKVIDILEKIEKRKFSSRLGAEKRAVPQYIKTAPVQVPPLSEQDPVEIRKVAPQAIAQEQIDRLLGAQIDRLVKGFQDQVQSFQNQIQTLQEKLTEQQTARQQATQVVPKQNAVNEVLDVMGLSKPYQTNDTVTRMAERMAKKLTKAQERREERELIRAMQGLSIDDDDDDNPIATTNAVRASGQVIGTLDDVDDENYTVQLVRVPKKK
jgi:hypothetical protein